jgi:hypothetical protein
MDMIPLAAVARGGPANAGIELAADHIALEGATKYTERRGPCTSVATSRPLTAA